MGSLVGSDVNPALCTVIRCVANCLRETVWTNPEGAQKDSVVTCNRYEQRVVVERIWHRDRMIRPSQIDRNFDGHMSNRIDDQRCDEHK